MLAQILWTQSKENTILAWDCSNTHRTMPAINAKVIKECEIQKNSEVVISTRNANIIQYKSYEKIQIHSCRIWVKSTIFYCGVLNHNFILPGGVTSELIDISKEDCMKLVQNGSFNLESVKLKDIPLGRLYFTSAELKGSIKQDGRCYGVDFEKDGRKYSNTVQTASFEILAQKHTTTFDKSSKHVQLEGAEHCNLKSDSCLSLTWGKLFWEIVAESECIPEAYDMLYQGLVKLIKTPNTKDISSVIFVDNDKFQVRLELKRHIKICGEKGFSTDQANIKVMLEDADHPLGLPWKNQSLIFSSKFQ